MQLNVRGLAVLGTFACQVAMSKVAAKLPFDDRPYRSEVGPKTEVHAYPGSVSKSSIHDQQPFM
jgi:hypothetical protein